MCIGCWEEERRKQAATYSPTNTLRSTIGAGGLNCRVRHGSGCTPSAITTCFLPNLYRKYQDKETRKKTNTKERLRPRCISTGKLKASQPLHPRPIKPVVSRTPYLLYRSGVSHLGAGFPLRCLQRLSDPHMATRLMHLATQPVH
jgi:hypothetical protein